VSRVSEVLAAARAEGRAALVGYLPAGYPSVDGAAEAMIAMVESGVEVVEIGLPYTDPLMDGPVIQRAVDVALQAGTRTADVLETVRRVADTGAAVLVMTYWNPVEHHGVERFAAELAAAGGSGLITPDLTPDEAEPWLLASDEHDLDRVFLVAPSSTDARLRYTTEHCRGFVYAASTMGVTGARTAVGSGARELVARTKAVTDLPVCVGLGVSTGAQAAEVGSFADGVIVGSALVRCLVDAEDAADPASGVAALRDLSRELAEGVRSASVSA
jgi:tryptophan synthase alpha chain